MDERDRNTEMGLNMPVRELNRGSPGRWVAASIHCVGELMASCCWVLWDPSSSETRVF